jgi:hypothetical protein
MTTPKVLIFVVAVTLSHAIVTWANLAMDYIHPYTEETRR